MAKRNELTDKLKPAGWHDQVGAVASGTKETDTDTASAGKYKRKTYLLTEDLIDRIEKMADAEHVGLNELVRWLLDDSLGRVETGETELPAAPVPKRTLGT